MLKKKPRPSLFLLSLWAPEFCAVVILLFVLFGNVYTGGVGAIVCWWRLEIHSRVPGEYHCWFLPQLAIVRPGAVTGWVSLPMWLVLPAPDRSKGEWESSDHSPISVWSCLPHHSHLVPFCRRMSCLGI